MVTIGLETGVKDKEDFAEFVGNDLVTFVPDTNAYLKSLNCITSIMEKMVRKKCIVAIPQQVQRELDGLQHNTSSKVRWQARQALKLICKFKAFAFVQPLLAFFGDLATLKGKTSRFL